MFVQYCEDYGLNAAVHQTVATPHPMPADGRRKVVKKNQKNRAAPNPLTTPSLKSERHPTTTPQLRECACVRRPCRRRQPCPALRFVGQCCVNTVCSCQRRGAVPRWRGRPAPQPVPALRPPFVCHVAAEKCIGGRFGFAAAASAYSARCRPVTYCLLRRGRGSGVVGRRHGSPRAANSHPSVCRRGRPYNFVFVASFSSFSSPPPSRTLCVYCMCSFHCTL